MNYLVISTSLSEKSRSRVMARVAYDDLKAKGKKVEWLDLVEHPLPFCDAGKAYSHPEVGVVSQMVGRASGIVLSGPVYNFDYNSAAKNLIELTGAQAWSGKIVGLMAAAGGRSSYMSLLSLGNSLTLDFRSVVLPRFVYATGEAFGANREIEDDAVRQRIDRLVEDCVLFTENLVAYTERERQDRP